MAKIYKTGIKFPSPLNYTSAVANDTREYVKSLSDLTNPETWVYGTYNATNDSKNAYILIPNQRVAVFDEGAIYYFLSDTVNKTTVSNADNWIRLATIKDIQSGVSSAIVYKGTKSYLSTVEAIVNPSIGDMYNVAYQGTSGTTPSGMNYVCYNRYANIGGSEVHEGFKVSGNINTGGTITDATIVFENGYAYAKVTDASGSRLYRYDSGDNVYVLDSTAPNDLKNPVLGKWDAFGTPTVGLVRESDLNDGTLKPAVAKKAQQLNTKRQIDGIDFDGTQNVSRYAQCDSNAGDDKEIYVSGFNLTAGVSVQVKFTYANTKTAPKLTVKKDVTDATGVAKAIKYGSTAFKDFVAGAVYTLTYNGDSWQVSGGVGGGTGISDDDASKLALVATPTNPYEIDVNERTTSDTTNYALYQQMLTDYSDATKKKKLKFILCDGVRCKFDINSCANDIIVFSFLCKGSYYEGKLTLTSASTATLAWTYKAKTLSTVFNAISEMNTDIEDHEDRITAVENAIKWVDLDSN